MSYQKVTLVGNLGVDPEMKYSPSGEAIVNFSMAVNETFRGVKSTAWFKIATWGKLSENCYKFLKKGSKVLVEGRLKYNDFGNPRVFQLSTGKMSSSFEILANSVIFLDPADIDRIEGVDINEVDEIPF